MTDVMIVEDEGLIALEIQESLEARGYGVPCIAASSEEACKLAREHKPDLILMDIHLKGDADGIETAKQIHESDDIPIIYLTAYSEDKTVERAKVTEPYGYILKPVEEKSLSITIEMAMQKHKSNRTVLESNKRFDSIFKGIEAGIIITDNEGSIQFFNTYAAEKLGTTIDIIKDKFIYDEMKIIDSEGTTFDRELFNSVINEGLKCRSDSAVLMTADGEGHPITSIHHPLEDDDGKTQGCAIIIMEKPGSAGEESGGYAGDSFFDTPEVYLEDNPLLSGKKALASYLEVELASLMMTSSQEETEDSTSEGKIEAYKNILRFYFGESILEKLEERFKRTS
jgi:PAS domain S-box-containing protein